MSSDAIKTEQDHTDIIKTLETIKDPKLKNTFSKLWENLEKTDHDVELDKIKKEISQSTPTPEQLIFSFLPHQLAKTSIFFPMSDKDLKEGKRKIDRIEQETSWGKIIIEGIKLAIIEEDVFLAIMNIAREKLKLNNNQYILKIKMKEIIHLLYGTSAYSTKKVNALILRTLNNFQLVRFQIDLYKKVGFKKVLRSSSSVGNIVQSHHYEPATDDLLIIFNPEFCKLFLESMLTNINFTLRRQLKRDGSKALLRFLSTHTDPGNMHICTVLNAINFNTNYPMKELRRSMKKFIAELKKYKVLGSKTKLHNDTVYFDVLPKKNLLSHSNKSFL
jgi:hypothetical protein